MSKLALITAVLLAPCWSLAVSPPPNPATTRPIEQLIQENYELGQEVLSLRSKLAIESKAIDDLNKQTKKLSDANKQLIEAKNNGSQKSQKESSIADGPAPQFVGTITSPKPNPYYFLKTDETSEADAVALMQKDGWYISGNPSESDMTIHEKNVHFVDYIFRDGDGNTISFTVANGVISRKGKY